MIGIGYGNESDGGVNNVAVLLSVEGQFVPRQPIIDVVVQQHTMDRR